MKKNEVYRVEITDVNNMGCGVGRIDGIPVFVNAAVTGDLVDAHIIKVTKSYCVARIKNLITASPYRTESDCAASAACGGCVYRHISYEHELFLKRRYVEFAFRKAGLPDITVAPVTTAGKICGYRNKAQIPMDSDGKTGFFAAKTHRIVECGSCALEPPIFQKIVSAAKEFFKKHGIRGYDEENASGIVRHIYLRAAVGTGEIMLCIVINADKMPAEKDFAEAMMSEFPEITSVLVNVNKKNTNVITGEVYRLIGGKDTIRDTLCGLSIDISAPAFYQVNHDCAELLYGKAAELAGEGERILDLYCGIGTIGLSIASKLPRASVTGIDIVPKAIEDAKKNAALAGIENASFICGDIADRNTDKMISDLLGSADTVILDPPRKGIPESLVDTLAEKNTQSVVYISCSPDTLARDAARFKEKGYSIGTVYPFDMFPRTGHVESVVCLTLGSDNELRKRVN